MRWWIELQTLGPARLALASLGVRVAVVVLILAVPTAVMGYLVVLPMLAERDGLIRDQHRLSQQWQAAQRDVADQRAVMAGTRDEMIALLRHWQDALAESTLAVVASSVADDQLTATVETDWPQWRRWLAALNDQPDVAVHLREVEIKAVEGAEAGGHRKTQNETDTPALRVAMTLTVAPQAAVEWSLGPAQALGRDPFAEVKRVVVPVTPEDPLARLLISELTIAGVIKREGQWEVLVSTRELPLQRRGLGAVLGVDGGVIAGIDHRKVTLRRHVRDPADQDASQIELPVRGEAVGDAWIRSVRRSES